MAKLAPEFGNLVRTTTTLPLDADTAEELLELTAPQLRAIAERASDLLGEGVGTLLVENRVSRASFPAALEAGTLAADPGFEALLAGTRTLGPGATDKGLVRLCQRALQAVAARVAGAPRALALTEWGADADYGAETVSAVTAFQQWRAVAGTPGTIARGEAQALRAALAGTQAPALFTGGDTGGLPSAGAARLVEVATRICNATLANLFTIRVDGRTYTYAAEYFGVVAALNGHIRAPGGVSYRVRPGDDYWKCNIFGGTCLAVAELPVPTHALSSGVRHFPRAERFGDALAAKRGWTLVAHLDHRDPADPYSAVVGPSQNAEIRALLGQIRPGDVFFVDHPGEPGNNGGHTRICVEAARAGDADVAPSFAQARYDKARFERNGMGRLGDGQELQFWLLRYVG